MGDFVTMPKLGMTMAEGTITKWLVSEGAIIEKGDYIFETETDKTALEVDSLLSGKLIKIYHFEGDTVKVNNPVAYIGDEGEEAPDIPMSAETPEPPEALAKMDTPVASPAPNQPQTQYVKTGGEALPSPNITEGISKAEYPEGKYDYDLIVIGAGPGGYVAAIRAAQLGAKVAIAEKRDIGGTCLNRGCIPTKALYSSARRYKDVRNAADLGINAKNISFDWEKIQARKDKIVKKLTGGVKGLLTKNGVKILKGEAHISKPHTVNIGKNEYSAAFILIATGTVPYSVIDSEAPIATTDEILSLAKLPESIAIIGGGVIGCEIAGILNSFGVKTTIIELLPRILPPVDEEVADLLASKMKREGIDLRLGVTVGSVKKTKCGYELNLSDGQVLKSELVMEAVGRCPERSIFAELEITVNEKGYILTDAYMRASTDCVYAIGDITGKYQLAHAASEQGILAVEHMFKGANAPARDIMPSCIFADMEIACAGLTEEQAKEQGLPYTAFKFPYAANGKALTLGETEGFVKVIKDNRWNEILGVHIIGADASSLIEEAVMAMNLESTTTSAGSTIHPHPVLSEMLMEAFLGVDGKAIHI
jgi:dihydrolipoamide dehydrogenase